MVDAFLHRRSVLDKHRDEYGLKDLLKQRRASRSWDNPITRHKREKGILDWAGSFAGKLHYRKLARYNAIHLHEENMGNYSNQEIIDAVKAADAATQSDKRSFDVETDDKGYRVDVWLKSKDTGEYLENPSWGVVTSVKQIATYSTDENGSADIIAESPYEGPECIKAFFTDAFKQYGAKGEAYEGARFGKHDIVQALARALRNDEDDKYSIRYFDSNKVGIKPGYAYASNKEGEDAWKVLDDGTVEFEFAGKPQGKLKVDSLGKLESTILKLFGMQVPQGRVGEGHGDAGASDYDTYVNDVSLVLEDSFGYSAITAFEFASDTYKDVTRQAFDANKSPAKAAQDIIDHCKADTPRKKKTAWSYVEEIEELEGEGSSQEVTEKILKALGCTQDDNADWYDHEGDAVGDVVDFLDNVEWDFAVKTCGPIQESKNEARGKKVVPKFVQINSQQDFDKYIKPLFGRYPGAYSLDDVKGMWWELGDGERSRAAKTMREIRDTITKRPRIIFTSSYGYEVGINDMSLTDYAKEMGMSVSDYLEGYIVESKNEVADKAGFSAFVRKLVDAAFGKFDEETWDRITSGYDVGRDYEQGYSVEDTVHRIQDWAFAESKKSETLEYEKGHKNSRGEDAPWVIRDHKGGKVLASFAKKGDAEAHLERMQHYSKSEDFESDLLTYEGDVYKALKSATKDLYSWDNGEWGAYVQDCLLDGVPAEKCAQAIAHHIANARCPKTIEVEIEGGSVLKEALREAKKKKLKPVGKNESALNLADTIIVPKWLWEAFYFGKDYSEKLTEEEERTLADFKAKYGVSKYYLAAPEGDAEFRSRNDFDNFGGLCYEISVYEKADVTEAKGLDSREVQAAVRSVWSTSGATDFKLDIVRSGDHITVYAKGPDGSDTIGIKWTIGTSKGDDGYEVKQFATDVKGNWPEEPERTDSVKGLDGLEAHFLDEFGALQETLDIGKENI